MFITFINNIRYYIKRKSFGRFIKMVSSSYFEDKNNFDYKGTVMRCLKACNIKKYNEILGTEHDCNAGGDVHKTLFYLRNNWK